MKRLCLILLLVTIAQSAAALTRQQEQVISATGFALFVGDYYYPACEHYELDTEIAQPRSVRIADRRSSVISTGNSPLPK